MLVNGAIWVNSGVSRLSETSGGRWGRMGKGSSRKMLSGDKRR